MSVTRIDEVFVTNNDAFAVPFTHPSSVPVCKRICLFNHNETVELHLPAEI